MKQAQRAFTLIELLVVIAIIAILAAILFPVFAQAKAAAKKTQEISNAKQLALGQMMYIGDSDDQFPLGGTINGAWATGYCDGTIGCPSWDKLTYPYVKNWQLMDSPLDKSQAVPFPNGNIKRSFKGAQNVFSGLTGKWWAPAEISKPSINASAAANSAGTIMLTNERNEGLYSGTWWVWSTWFENWVWTTTANSTRANNPTLLTPNAGDSTPAELGGANNYWRGVDVSQAGTSTFVFLDGHTKSHSKGYIFPGYQQRAGLDYPVNAAFPGVCLAADQWGSDTSKDCKLPD